MALRTRSSFHKHICEATLYLEMPLSYENLNWLWLSKPQPLVPQPSQGSHNLTIRNELVQRLVPHVNKEMPFLQLNRPPAAQRRKNHLVRNTVDAGAIFEMWTFQTKSGNSLLLALKEVTLWCQGVRFDCQATQRGDSTEGKDHAFTQLSTIYRAPAMCWAHRMQREQTPALPSQSSQAREAQTGETNLTNRGRSTIVIGAWKRNTSNSENV